MRRAYSIMNIVHAFLNLDTNETGNGDDIVILSDEDIVAASITNPDHYSILIDRYTAPLSRYVRRRASVSQEDVDDILQDVFIKAYTHLTSFDPRMKFSSWLYRIAHNHIISWYRRHEVRHRDRIMLDDHDALKLFSGDDGLGPDVQAIFNDDAQMIHAALAELPDQYRDMMMLRFFEGLDYDSMSDVLKIPPGTVATRLNRGKKKLQKIIDGMHHV